MKLASPHHLGRVHAEAEQITDDERCERWNQATTWSGVMVVEAKLPWHPAIIRN